MERRSLERQEPAGGRKLQRGAGATGTRWAKMVRVAEVAVCPASRADAEILPDLRFAIPTE